MAREISVWLAGPFCCQIEINLKFKGERWRGKFSQVTSVSLSGKVEQCAREEINPLILDFPAGHPVFPAEKQARLG